MNTMLMLEATQVPSPSNTCFIDYGDAKKWGDLPAHGYVILPGSEQPSFRGPMSIVNTQKKRKTFPGSSSPYCLIPCV